MGDLVNFTPEEVYEILEELSGLQLTYKFGDPSIVQQNRLLAQLPETITREQLTAYHDVAHQELEKWRNKFRELEEEAAGLEDTIRTNEAVVGWARDITALLQPLRGLAEQIPPMPTGQPSQTYK